MLFKIFFKIGFILRKKLQALKVDYLILEHKALFPGRVTFPEIFKPENFPMIYLDSSASTIKIGRGVSFRGRLSLLAYSGSHIEIGESVFFNDHCSINSLGKITIGANTLFGEGVKLYDHNHIFRGTPIPIKEQGYRIGAITIGENCWIGSNTVILKDVNIGDNVVIGANNIIYKSIPANTVIVNKQESLISGY